MMSKMTLVIDNGARLRKVQKQEQKSKTEHWHGAPTGSYYGPSFMRNKVTPWMLKIFN